MGVGVRVQHSVKRSGFFVLSDPTRPILGDVRTFPKCPTCVQVHTHKTYHILLNGEGAAVVSPRVLDGLRRAGAFDPLVGLAVAGEVLDPPTVVLGRRDGRLAPVPQRDRIIVYHE